MTPELDKALCEDFPGIFCDRHNDMKSTLMCWGFDCGPGWEPIIRTLCEQLTLIQKISKIRIVALQVKERHGSLRFYVTQHLPEKENAALKCWVSIIDELAYSVTNKSMWICEVCGEYGSINKEGYWLSCRCKNCRQENHY